MSGGRFLLSLWEVYKKLKRFACEHLLKIFGPTPEFLCEVHDEQAGQIANRIIRNIYFDNAQKESRDAKRKDSMDGSKKR